MNRGAYAVNNRNRMGGPVGSKAIEQGVCFQICRTCSSTGDSGVSVYQAFRVLVVDDYEPFRRFVCSTLGTRPELQIVGEVSDGLEAVHKAEELQPDLIVLDIGLPTLNGIEAARRMRKLSPESKILFISQESSADVVREAFSLGALGYVVKVHAGSDLLPAVKAVLQGKQFVSASLTGHDSNAPKDDHAAAIRHCHEVAFHADDDSVVDGYARFIESALKSGNAVIVVVTEAHRASLLSRLEADGVDVAAAIKEGSYLRHGLNIVGYLRSLLLEFAHTAANVGQNERVFVELLQLDG